jgi:hypothetical protein
MLRERKGEERSVQWNTEPGQPRMAPACLRPVLAQVHTQYAAEFDALAVEAHKSDVER